MRDFSWQYFTYTGDIDAYMLYKEMDADHELWQMEEEEQLGDALSGGSDRNPQYGLWRNE